MPAVALLLLSCSAGFVIGSIPFGYLAGHLVLKDDIRNHGSGNIGATNVGRVLGLNWGVTVLVLDALKGVIPTLAAAYAAELVISAEWIKHAAVAAGVSSVLGHMYPICLRLQGGKGVATALGVVIVLAPRVMGIALLMFVVVLTVSRKVALASMLAAVTFAVAYLLRAGNQAWTVPAASLTAFSTCVPLLILWRHRRNIERLLAGTEPAFTQKVSPVDRKENSSKSDRFTELDDA